MVSVGDVIIGGTKEFLDLPIGSKVQSLMNPTVGPYTKISEDGWNPRTGGPYRNAAFEAVECKIIELPKGNEMEKFNDTQRKILEYLLDERRTYPRTMLKDLSTILSTNYSGTETLLSFNKYLTENTEKGRAFCSEGVQRARDALNIKPPFKSGDVIKGARISDLPVGSAFTRGSYTFFVVQKNIVRSDGTTFRAAEFGLDFDYTVIHIG